MKHAKSVWARITLSWWPMHSSCRDWIIVNSLYRGLPKLQRVQHCAIRLVSGKRGSHNIQSWKACTVVRINFKIFSSYLFAFITCQIFTSSLTLLISISFYKFLLLIPWLMAIAHFHIMHQKSGTVNHIISNILNVFPFSSNVWEVFFLETIIVHSLFRFKQGILSALRILKYAMKTHNYYYYYYWKEWVALSMRISFIITCARALRFESTQIWDTRSTVRVCTTNSTKPKTAETAVHGCLTPGRVI